LEFLAPIRDQVPANAALAAGHRVLDVGCGDGLIAFAAAEVVGPAGQVIFSDVSSDLPYVELQRRDDVVGGHAYRRYSKGHYLPALPDEAIEAFLLRGGADGRDGPLANVSMQAYGGAIADVPDTDAAFSHGQTMFEFGAGTPVDRPGGGPGPDGTGPARRGGPGALRPRRVRQRAR
jgi:SAM-dependent methyltransferase